MIELPETPTRPDVDYCGICGSDKLEAWKEVMWCPHCDEVCNMGGACRDCMGGYRGIE